MGYYMDQQETRFRIDAGNLPLAHKALAQSGLNGGWIRFTDLEKSKNFTEAMSSCRYDVEIDSNGNVFDITFTGEKLGDDVEIFGLIAPYVKRGSYIEMRGEDGATWRWNFDGKEVREIYPDVAWPDMVEGD